MANIATVQLLIELSGGETPTDAELVMSALDAGSSYCVPLYLSHQQHTIQLQFGWRNIPGPGPAAVWQCLRGCAERMWVRWLDDGADYDQLFCIDAGGQSLPVTCRYACDTFVSQGPPRPMQGTYAAGNARSFFDHHPLASPTTLQGPRHGRPGLIEPPALAEWMEHAWRKNLPFDLFFRDRLVYRSDGTPGGHWNLDHWDNCADFLQACPLAAPNGSS